MITVRIIVFQAPVPIPGSQRREPLFDSSDGWTLERDDGGDWHIAGHGVDFWTDGIVSWMPMPEHVVTGHEPKSQRRKR